MHFPYGGNVGVKLVKTHLDVNQHTVSPDPVAYYVNQGDGGVVQTKRDLTDTLPVANLFVDLSHALRLRLGRADAPSGAL